MSARIKAVDTDGSALGPEAEAHYAKALELATALLDHCAGKTAHHGTQRAILAILNLRIERVLKATQSSPLAFVVGSQEFINDVTAAGDAVALALKSWFDGFEVPLEVREAIGLAIARANADSYAQHALGLSAPPTSPLKH